MIRRSIPSRVPRTPPGRAQRLPSERSPVRRPVANDGDEEPEDGDPSPPRSSRRFGGHWLPCALAACLLAPLGATQDEPARAEGLAEHALALELHHGKRRTKAAKVESRLAPTVRLALNEWAGVIAAHDLSVAVPEEANAILIGSISDKQLAGLARALDETHALFEELQPADHDPGLDPAVVGFVFDEQGLHGEPLAAVVDRLVERNALPPGGAQSFLAHPGGLAMRHASTFIQPGYDMAGDAAAGDDEFRLLNATIHQTVQAMATRRFGQLPGPVLWGLGFVAEQRQCGEVYHFGGGGFIASSDHFDWPDKARDLLDDGAPEPQAAWLGEADAGRLTPPQLLAWAQLDHGLHDDPEALAGLLHTLGELHDEAHPFGGTNRWGGDAERAGSLVREHLDGLSDKALGKHLKRLR